MNKLRIIAQSNQPFKDRAKAGSLLGLALKDFYDKDAIVLGIPGGGVVIAYEIADVLDSDLDIVLTRKIGSAESPELAIGAVEESGRVFLNGVLADQLGISADFTHVKERELALIRHRRFLFRRVYPKVPLKDRTVIIADDGAVTGATLQAALWSVRRERPAKVIVAVPVAPQEALERLALDADEVVCLRVPSCLSTVEQHYLHFPEIGDDEVLEILTQSAKQSLKS